ncbi:MAG: NAD(P)-dependent oxidoreductase [Syntrophomonadaceae bacterium]|nr:NAD(P)-dependent oxidoreductase [Syntrophomonadaceae bacterium]
MTVAVIGGTGFIGAIVCKQLVESDQKVICIDYNPFMDRIKSIRDKMTIINANITQFEELLEIFMENKITAIIDFAYLLDTESTRKPHQALKINIMGTNNVFEAARLAGIKRVIWSSSVAIYGRKDPSLSLTEDEPCQPLTVYGACKQLGEFMSQVYNQKYGMEIAAIRPSAVFGPGRITGLSSFISDIVTLPALGLEAVIPSSPDKRSTYTFVDDMAADFISLALAPKLEHAVYNARGWVRSYGDVADTVRKYIPDAKITFTGSPTYYASWLDGSRLEAAVQRPLKYTFEEGIKEQINRVRQFGALGI